MLSPVVVHTTTKKGLNSHPDLAQALLGTWNAAGDLQSIVCLSAAQGNMCEPFEGKVGNEGCFSGSRGWG